MSTHGSPAARGRSPPTNGRDRPRPRSSEAEEPMRLRFTRSTAIAGAAVGLLVAALTVAPAPSAQASGGPNLAAGRPTAESSHTQTYASGNIDDGNQAT